MNLMSSPVEVRLGIPELDLIQLRNGLKVLYLTLNYLCFCRSEFYMSMLYTDKRF